MVDLKDVGALLFDMDGTLVDSDAAVERAWVVWADEYGVDVGALLAIAHGSPAETTVRRVLPGLDPTGVAEATDRQHALQYDDLVDVVPTVGAERLLAGLKLPWAVVTSADDRLAKARLTAVGIDPPLLVTIQDVTVGKPDPEGYLKAADRLRVPPDRCLVVEDSAPGVAAGKAAGAMVAALKGVPADLQISDLDRLADLLAEAGLTAQR